MPTFQITGPDGKKYRVTGENPEGAMKALRQMTDKAAAPTQQHPEFDGSNIPGYNPETGMVEQSGLSSAAQGAADMVTFGAGDEMAAGLSTLLPGAGGYDENLAGIRGMQERAQEDNPKSFLGGQVGGAVAQALATRGAGFLPSATTLGMKALGGALTGAAYGGAYGLGSGEGTQDRLIEGAKGAGIGAAAGGAFPLIAQGASSAYQKVADALMGRSIAKGAGASPEALRMLGNVMDADGSLGPTGQANIARAGPEAMLADAGPNARAVLDAAIQRGGPGAVAARQAIADRTGRAQSAITGALDNTLGAPEGVTAARTAIRQGSAGARSGAYETAYKAPINYADPRGQSLEKIIKGRVPANVIAEANALMRINGEESAQILAKVADDGSVAFETLPDVRQIDYITRALKQVAETGDGAGALGGQTQKGRAYENLARDIRTSLRDLVPEYGQALETAADPISRSKAVELGSKLLSPSLTRDQVDEAVRGMTGPEKDALAQGVRSRLDDLMANVGRTVQDGDTGAREAIKAIKDLSSRANREKLTAAIGKPKADALFDEIDKAATSFDLRASVAENSKTFARDAINRRVGDLTQPGPIGKAAQGEPIKAAKGIVQLLTGQTPEKIRGKEDAIYSEIAKLLTRTGGAGQGTYDAVGKIGKSDQATRLMAERIAAALSGPRLAYPTTQLLSERYRQ